MAFSRTYDEISDLLENDAPVVLIAELSDDEEQMRIVTHKLFRWDKKESLPQVVVLELDLEQLDPESLLDFRSQLDEVAGITPLRLELLTDSERISYQTKSMRIDKSRIEELQLSCPWLKHSIRIDIGKLLEPSKTEEPRYYSKQNSTPTVDVPF